MDNGWTNGADLISICSFKHSNRHPFFKKAHAVLQQALSIFSPATPSAKRVAEMLKYHSNLNALQLLASGRSDILLKKYIQYRSKSRHWKQIADLAKLQPKGQLHTGLPRQHY